MKMCKSHQKKATVQNYFAFPLFLLSSIPLQGIQLTFLNVTESAKQQQKTKPIRFPIFTVTFVQKDLEMSVLFLHIRKINLIINAILILFL